MAQKVSMGIIGAGRIGRLHAEHLVHRISGAEVRMISDIRLDAAEQCASELGVAKAEADYRKVLEDKEIEAVVICSSTDTHAGIIAEAAQAGKHIFCEKPIALDLGKIDSALQTVSESKVKLQIGFNRRFDPNFRRIWEGIQVGGIGEPHILRITSRDPAPPPIDYVKVSGGLFLDMMIHDFDMARYLIGEVVEEVFALGGVRIDPAIGEVGDIDTAIVTLKFKNGVFGAIDNSRQAVYGYDQRVEVFGSAGMLATENNTPNRVRFSTAQAVQEDLPLNFFMERYIESYVAEMEAFVDCILQDGDPPVGGIDGRMPVMLGMAARMSYEQNRPVALSELS
jgi:myo-inositol 2-dehydrogenase/D-chiro-inositol 1-dehydrogenase